MLTTPSKKAAIYNLGCKVNSYEARAMEENLEENGYELVSFTEYADVYIVNTCTVTNIASRKSRQMMHRAKKINPKGRVVAVGCYVHIMEQEDNVDSVIDVMIGNNRKQELVEILQELLSCDLKTGSADINADSFREGDGDTKADSFREGNAETKADSVREGSADTKADPIRNGSVHIKVDLNREESDDAKEGSIRKEIIDISQAKEYEKLSLTKPGEHTRANVKVQDGCNQFCSYCIVPMVRGRARSRPLEEAIKEVSELAGNGCKEVVLTGIHLPSYGEDLEDISLLDLIQEVHKIPGICRIRLGSLEPRIITEKFVKTLSSLEKFCPHFHLSLQSGCDEILKMMNRRYTTKEYLEKCQLIREHFTHPSITTDIIVGFPGETEEDFLTTKSFVEMIGFHETHIFKYSKREGTAAAKLTNQISEKVKSRRSEALIELGKEKKKEFERYYLGKEVEILVEGRVKSKGHQVGYTKEYVEIAINNEENLQNQMVSVKILEESQFVH